MMQHSFSSHRGLARQRGIALPVMLIILVVMLFGSIYMMKASNNTSLVTASLAYDSTMSRAADLGLLRATAWLNATATGTNKGALNADSPTNGYVASYNPAIKTTDDVFWANSVKITDTSTPANTIEYVIHRMCSQVGTFDSDGTPPNSCVKTTQNLSISGGTTAPGDSLATDAVPMAGPPQIHYVVTARIFGPRGGNVVNQAVVMIGA